MKPYQPVFVGVSFDRFPLPTFRSHPIACPHQLYADARMTILNTTHSCPIIDKEAWEWEGAIIRSGTESGGKLSECTDKRVCVCVVGGRGNYQVRNPVIYIFI